MARKRLLKGISGVYCMKNLENSKRYVGSSINLGKRKKEHFFRLKENISGHRPLQEEYNKFGKQNFIFEVLEYCEKENLIEREQYWIDHYKSWDREFGYNTSVTAGKITHTEETKKRIGDFHRGKKDSAKTKKLKSESLKGRVFSEEHKKKIGEGARGNTKFLGKKHSEEAKKKISEKNRGKKRSEELCEKNRERMMGNTYARGKNLGNTYAKGKNLGNTFGVGNKNRLGKKHTEETKLKISEKIKVINLGKRHSEETKEKIGKASKIRMLGNTYMLGKKHSEEARQKMRDAWKIRNNEEV